MSASDTLQVLVTVEEPDRLSVWRLPSCLHRGAWGLRHLRVLRGVAPRPCSFQGLAFMEDGAGCPLAVCDQGNRAVHWVDVGRGTFLGTAVGNITQPLGVACHGPSNRVAVTTGAGGVAMYREGALLWHMVIGGSVNPMGVRFVDPWLCVANVVYSGGLLFLDCASGRLQHSVHVGQGRRHTDLQGFGDGTFVVASTLSQDVIVMAMGPAGVGSGARARVTQIVCGGVSGTPSLAAAQGGDRLFVKDARRIRTFYRGACRGHRHMAVWRLAWLCACVGAAPKTLTQST